MVGKSSPDSQMHGCFAFNFSEELRNDTTGRCSWDGSSHCPSFHLQYQPYQDRYLTDQVVWSTPACCKYWLSSWEI